MRKETASPEEREKRVESTCLHDSSVSLRSPQASRVDHLSLHLFPSRQPAPDLIIRSLPSHCSGYSSFLCHSSRDWRYPREPLSSCGTEV